MMSEQEVKEKLSADQMAELKASASQDGGKSILAALLGGGLSQEQQGELLESIAILKAMGGGAE